MIAASFGVGAAWSGWWSRNRRQVRETSPGVLISALLHALVIVALLVALKERLPKTEVFRIVPVSVVEIEGGSENTGSGAARGAAPVKEQHAVPQMQATPKPARARPVEAPSPADPLDAQLRALSRLRQDSAVPSQAPAAEAGTSGDGGAPGTGDPYGVRDLIRTQILRRWSLDLDVLGTQDFQIAIRVLLARNGTVLKAEVVDRKRYRADKVFHQIALSARNAVILSSPLLLPAGRYGETTEVTLLLDPRDALQ